MPTDTPTAPTEPTEDLVAGLIRDFTAELGSPDTPGRARDLARSVLDLLVGPDDEPGPLDRIRIMVVNGLVAWYCNRGCGQNGNGTVGIIARNFEGDQTDLTLGELVGAALNHERDDHPAGVR